MNANEVLAHLRYSVAVVEKYQNTPWNLVPDKRVLVEAAIQGLIEDIRMLDESLSNGGTLPSAWSGLPF